MNLLQDFHAWIERRRRRLREEHAALRRVSICTIATRAFVPWALVLFESLRRQHPHADLVLLYVRENDEAYRVPTIPGVHVIGIDAVVDREQEERLRSRYGLGELCFSLKPRLLGHCLDRVGERAIYLDSDIDVLGPLTEALVLLEEASVALTPHLDTAVPTDGKIPTSMTMLRAGSFNAGFIGVRECAETRQMLEWWDERVSRWGFLAPEMGYQGDQKWLDLAPALFPGLQLLRDPGSNVGAWNLHSRRLTRDEQGTLRANDAALAFVHFSGFDPERPEVISRYQNRHHPEDQPVLMAIARDFAGRVLEADELTQDLEWSEPPEPPPKEGIATARPDAMPDAGYRARIDVRRLTKGVLAATEELELVVTVTNDSPVKWEVDKSPFDGKGGIALTWHLRTGTGAMFILNNRRYFLERDLGPGESIEIRVGERVPMTPGVWQYEFVLVHEHFAWFKDKGSPTTTLTVAVDAFPPGEPAL